MSWPTQNRWAALCGAGGLAEIALAWYERLQAAYAEPQRHYHTQQHISECLKEFDSVKGMAKDPIAIELAIWFHDAVYDPKANDNEERSAVLARRFVEEAHTNDKLSAAVTELVMATKSHTTGRNPDAELMVDVDLSIFGQNEARFLEYEEQIRREYSWVPEATFKTRRAEILQRFLDRDHIYRTESLRVRYEKQARQNLQASIAMLMPP